MLQADSAGRVRLKLIVRIGHFSCLQSREIITIGKSRSHLSDKSGIGMLLREVLFVVQAGSERMLGNLRFLYLTTIIQVFIFDYGQISKRRTFENLGFLKLKFSYLTMGEYRKLGCLKIWDFQKSSFFSYFTTGENRKVEFIKVGEKIQGIRDIWVFDLAEK